MQVRHRVDPVLVVVKVDQVVGEVAPVPVHLTRGVEHRFWKTRHGNERVVALEGFCRGPLLQLYDDEGRIPCFRVSAGQDDVGALRREWKRVLQQDIDRV